MNKVAVIDYGMGNLHSVAKALEHCGEAAEVIVTSDGDLIRSADRVVFPGVGAIRDCIQGLKDLGLDEVIREVARSKPLLAVCVGMQALMDHSVENQGVDCLGILPGRVASFQETFRQAAVHEHLKVPHMGWNQVHQTVAHPLWHGIRDHSRYYFVHSYYVQPTQQQQVMAVCDYGVPFAAAVGRDNVFAVQFHPEKSQHDGLTLYANFLRWNGAAL